MSSQKVWSGTASIKGATEMTRMAMLTVSLAGIQLTWGLEATYCTPYLLDLGLTKSKTTFVWLAGPLSGLITASAVGAIADKCTSRWGRRRPFMVGGALALAVCLFILGWAKEIVSFVLGEEASNGTPTLFLAISSIFALDFAINTVQWSSRSLIVDMLPISKQQTGTAWGSRMMSIGHLVGYFLGALDLEIFFGNALGSTQFKRLIVLAIIALFSTIGVTSWAVTERVLVSDPASGGISIGIFGEVIRTALHMPKKMKGICWVLFWSWIGWFPFLFYSSEWVGEIYLRHESDPSKPIQDRLVTIGRVGSTALIVFSIITLGSSLALPLLVQSPGENRSDFTPRPPPSLAPVVDRVTRSKPSLLTAWQAGQFVFAGTLLLAPFVKSVWMASLLVSLNGLPWALTTWAPHALMGEEISRIGRSSGRNRNRRSSRPGSNDGWDVADDMESHELGHDDDGENENHSGIYLGILNMFITMPQFIGSFMSWVIFAILEPGRGLPDANDIGNDEGYNGIGVILFIGGLCALVAAYAAKRLKVLSS